jgi:hypothetical protein
MKILGCVQPTYIPWYWFFYRIKISDVFILLDDVEYSKNNSFNRNKIINNNNETMLTVPINYKNNSKTKLKDITINYDRDWRKKHINTIIQSYSKFSLFKNFEKDLKIIYEKKFDKLIDLNFEIIEFFLNYFEISTSIYKSSDIDIKGNSNEKLIGLCKYFNADYFIVKPNTDNYHPEKIFNQNKIKFKYLDYSKICEENIKKKLNPKLSILDYATKFRVFN